MGRHRDCRCLFFRYITTITTTSIVIIDNKIININKTATTTAIRIELKQAAESKIN